MQPFLIEYMNVLNFFFPALILVYSCSSSIDEYKIEEQKVEFLSEIPEPVDLVGERIETESYGLYKLYYLDFIDSLLVISTNTDGKLIAVYDQNGKYVGGFGKIAQGPNELNDSPIIYNHQTENNQTIVTTFDNNLLTLDKINLTRSIADNNLVIESTYEFPKELRRISTAFYVNSTKITGVYEGQFYKNLDQRTGLYTFNPTTGDFITERLPNIDFKSSNPSNVTYGHYITRLNARRSDLSPSNTYFTTIMRYIPLLQIFKVGKSSFEHVGSYYLDNEIRNYHYEMDLFERDYYNSYYLDLSVSDKYIYLLKNSNKAIGDEAREVNIEVINWEGVPQAAYRISSNFDINVFTVNEKDSIIYGLSYSQDALYKFLFNKSQ